MSADIRALHSSPATPGTTRLTSCSRRDPPVTPRASSSVTPASFISSSGRASTSTWTPPIGRRAIRPCTSTSPRLISSAHLRQVPSSILSHPTSICSAQARRFHPRVRAHPVVLGPLHSQLPGQVRCRQAPRLSHPEAPLVVRRGISDAGPQLLDDPAASRQLHQSLRYDGGHHRE